jgi:hypothetical protein
MKKARAERARNGMRPEYDFSKGVRGKYAQRVASGSNVVVLEPDVAEAYPDARVVNEVLRAVARVAVTRPKSRPRR